MECHLAGGKEPELVRECMRGTRTPKAGGQRSTLLSFHLISGPYVLDTRVKRGAELSTDHHLVVSWIRWQRRKLDRPGRPKRILRVCWERLAEPSVREVFNSHLRKSFSQIPREAGDIESEWTMFSASIVDDVTRQFEVVDARSLVPVVVAEPPNPVVDTGSKGCRQAEEGVLSDHVGLWPVGLLTHAVDRYRQAKQATQPGRSWRQKLGSGRSSVRPWRRTIGRPRRDSGKPSGASEGGSSTLPTLFTVRVWELLTSTGDIVGWWKKYFEDLLNPTDLPSTEEEEAEAEDSQVDSSITQSIILDCLGNCRLAKVSSKIFQMSFCHYL
ncbi:hypothetical protein L3Q82_003639 [Scortum barcoo]|uniref:Uncharacterized protein n=1 Tax=Scortum barcoo TaxID=214431 RepID=A0ACB8VR51_9TELE|nr:hypothetical protein L3Q82_003639 [Scortum barcoo]